MKENRVHQTKISTKTDKSGFSPAVFRSSLDQKTPTTEYLFCCVFVLFSMAKAMLRMSGVFVSVTITFCSFVISAEKVPLAQCSRVRFSKVIPLVNQKRTFDERIRCITRHDDISPRSQRAVSLQVAPFPREYKGRGYGNLIQVNLKERF